MNAQRWRSIGLGLGGLAALAILFLAVVMLSSLGLRGMRLDLTHNKLYTLSSGTQQVLGDLKEPVNLYFYFSRDAAAKQAPLVMPYASRVREFLEEIAARAGGKIHLQVIDPQPFSDEEDHAADLGLQALQTGGTGDALFFGLAGTNSTDGRSVIPSFQPDREEFLEYDVAKLIQELGTPKKPVIGLMSSIGLQGQLNPMTGQTGDPWPIYTQIQQLFTVRTVALDVEHIDHDVDVLMLVHPKDLPPQTLYAIDQFVMRGGRMLLLVDPDAGADISGQDPSNPMARMANHASDLQPLLSTWGVDYDSTKVIGDLALGMEVRTGAVAPPIRHIGILGLRRDDMEQKDVVSASLEAINLATVGSLAAHAGAKTRFEPLLLSSTSAEPIPAARFDNLSDPGTLRDGFKSTGVRYAIAARVTGDVESAYPKGSPVDQKAATGPPTAHLSKSTTPANLVIIADTDFLMDYLWVQTREMLGQRVAQTFANNGDFIANILDNLSGSGALISVRGRASFSRPFERIEALKRQADERLRGKALELQSELQQTESKLAELQGKRNDQNSITLSPDQEAELKRFTAEKARMRKELRETQRGLDVDINRLDSRLKALNIAVAPLLVTIVGVFVLARRRRRPGTSRPNVTIAPQS